MNSTTATSTTTMRHLGIKRLIKIMVVIIIALIVLPHVMFTTFFKTSLSKEELMFKHFKKASVYEKKPVKSKTRQVISNLNATNKIGKTQVMALVPTDNYRDKKDNLMLLNHMKKHDRWKEKNNIHVFVEKKPTPSKPKPTKNYNCQYGNYTTFQTKSYCLKDDTFSKYFTTQNHKHYCLKEGTEFILKNGSECFCRSPWHGPFCSMHDVVFKSNYPHEYGYMYQSPPRRLIYAFPFAQEFDMLETRFNEYGDIVDLYIIVESNYTASGQPKPRRLLNRLRKGEFKDYQHKILYVSLDYFPKKAYYNGWLIDGLLRNTIADHGLDLVDNLRDDDVFFISDADELPVHEALLFLKLHQVHILLFVFIKKSLQS